MTYGTLKKLTSALLIGDNQLTKDEGEISALLAYAISSVANKADALKLFTADKTGSRILRQGPANMFVRMPQTPESDDDELDLDEELCFACSRYIASFVSRDKSQMHLYEANDIISMYNAKVLAYMQKHDQENEAKDME
jgi:hypothetical protein